MLIHCTIAFVVGYALNFGFAKLKACTYAEFLVNLVVVSLKSRELSLKFAFGGCQVDIDCCQLINTSMSFFKLLFGSSLSPNGLFQRDARFFQFSSELLYSSLRNAQLIDSLLQLSVDLVIMCLQFLSDIVIYSLANIYRRTQKLTCNCIAWRLIVFCKSMLCLLAASRDISSSVICICIFFLIRAISVLSFASASAKRRLSCSISIAYCLLKRFLIANFSYMCHAYQFFLP